MLSTMNSPDSTLPLPPERLAVLDRLPEGVEFTLVKLILSAAPPFTRTHLWTDRESHDPLRARFRTQTYDQVDRALDKVAAALPWLPQERQPAARQRLDDLRFEWASQVMGEVAGLPRRPGDKVVDTRSVDPARQGTPLVATGLDGPGMVIDVWQLTDELPVLVERWALPAMLMPWREGDPVPWVGPEIIAAVYKAIVCAHFSDVLGLRVGHRWRTEREPAGWPFLTRYAIPKLYDYLHPYYDVRGYTHGRLEPGPGHFPAALRQDIVDLVKLECPHLAATLTVSRVTAIIQRHVRTADPKRPMGFDMFGLRLTTPP
jgi:hypothetical protein